VSRTQENRAFEKQIAKFLKVVDKTGTKGIRSVSLQALKMVMQKSPVDFGTFRGNWNVGLNTINSTFQTGFQAEPAFGGFDNSAFWRGNSVVAGLKLGDMINISNSLPYANRLEYTNYSAQGTAMVRRTIIEITQWLKSQNDRV
jgi:hypothetical protein